MCLHGVLAAWERQAVMGTWAVALVELVTIKSHSALLSVFVGGCNKVHFHLPYRWQVMNANTWADLQPMESIEKAYCDPKIFM